MQAVAVRMSKFPDGCRIFRRNRDAADAALRILQANQLRDRRRSSLGVRREALMSSNLSSPLGWTGTWLITIPPSAGGTTLLVLEDVRLLADDQFVATPAVRQAGDQVALRAAADE